MSADNVAIVKEIYRALAAGDRCRHPLRAG